MGDLNNILSTKGLSIGYGAGTKVKPLLKDLNLSIPPGKMIALLGANGVGKSTLIRTLAKLQPALAGEILLGVKHLSEFSAKALAQKVSVVLTNPVSVGRLTVKELVSIGRYPYTDWTGKLRSQDINKVEEAIALCAIGYLEDANLSEISDGQRQKAMIARALAQDGELMLLDEPTAHLDANNRYMVLKLLRDLVDKTQKSILISTHQVEMATHMADVLWLATCGSPIIVGSPTQTEMLEHLQAMFPYINKYNH